MSSESIMRKRLDPLSRRDELLEIALQLAIEKGYTNLDRSMIAKKAGVSISLITEYFKPFKELKKELMFQAVKRNIVQIIAQGLSIKDPLALKVSPRVKQQATSFLLK